ncbi:unnamed protein product [Arctia plantaginis]|uniref:Uncharacterized protein n=1 Tax=Arctia plantaginis TaxID=874455 RepID=A0A8S0YXD1_ARCPL|nr:unnamed protein product [Arctia plantaginis]CAB3242278.1 unnamed protein product [Arctia plantaginis]
MVKIVGIFDVIDQSRWAHDIWRGCTGAMRRGAGHALDSSDVDATSARSLPRVTPAFPHPTTSLAHPSFISQHL